MNCTCPNCTTAGLAGFGYVQEAIQLASAAYSMFGPKPNYKVDAVVYSAQPPPPTYQNWTPVLVVAGVAAVALTLILTNPKRRRKR